MTLQNELLNAVDALTLPYVTKVMQSNDQGIHCVTTIDHDPRLQHLRESIVGGIGGHGGSSNEPRLPFDAGALALYDAIEGEVAVWFVELTGKPVFASPEQTLRQWYLAFDDAHRKGDVSDQERWDRTNQLKGWAAQIDGKFDPPKQIEFTVTIREPVMVPVVRHVTNDLGYRVPVVQKNPDGTPKMRVKVHWRTKEPLTRVVERRPATCPECGENTAHDPRTGDKILALVLEYRDESTQTVQNAVIRCRSCEATWEGSHGCRTVAWEIEQEETRLNERASA